MFVIKTNAYSYETVIIDFPDDEGWHSVLYLRNEKEAIVQFLPRGETKDNWTRSVVFHSFKGENDKLNAKKLQNRLITQSIQKNKTLRYKMLKNNQDDTLTYWCVDKNEIMPSQCELLRTTQGHESTISIHYIDKNKKTLNSLSRYWYNIIRDTRIYYSYYRMDRLLNRATIFEL